METEFALAITVYHRCADARPIWRRFEADGLHYAFQTCDWLTAWQTHVGEPAGLLPCLVAVEDHRGGRVMFLPLAVRHSLGGRCLEWLGGRHADYHAPLLGSGFVRMGGVIDLATLWPRILAHLPPVDVLHFEKQPAEILGFRNPFLDLGATPAGVSAHAARLGPVWDDYYAAHRGTRTRATDRRKLRRLQDQGQVVLRLDVPPDEVAAVMPRLIDLKRRQLGRVGGKDPFSGPGSRAFYDAMAAGGQEHPRVMVSTLELDGKVIAAHWGMVAGRRFYWLLPVYDDAWRAFSPGLHLMQALMEWCCGNGIEVFDFTLGDEDYKASWCDRVTPLYEQLSLIGWRGLGPVGLGRLHELGRAMLRQVPVLARLKRQLRRSLIRR